MTRSFFDISRTELQRFRRGERTSHQSFRRKLNDVVDRANDLSRAVQAPHQVRPKTRPISEAVGGTAPSVIPDRHVILSSFTPTLQARQIIRPTDDDGIPIIGEETLGDPFAVYAREGLILFQLLNFVMLEYEEWEPGDPFDPITLPYLPVCRAVRRAGIWNVDQPAVTVYPFTVETVGNPKYIIARSDAIVASPPIAIARLPFLTDLAEHNGTTFSGYDSTGQDRHAIKGADEEDQTIVPRYVAGDTIHAIGPVFTGVVDADGLSIWWLDISATRNWGVI